MKEPQTALPYLVFAGGLVAGIILASLLIPDPAKPPCADPPGAYHTVKIFFDDTNGDPVLIVDPDPAGPAEQCDVVTFVNATGQEITIDFGAAEGSIGTPFNEVEKFVIKPEGVEGGYTKSPQVWVETPEEPVDYKYHVSVGETEQSPVIRIGPRKPVVSENP